MKPIYEYEAVVGKAQASRGDRKCDVVVASIAFWCRTTGYLIVEQKAYVATGVSGMNGPCHQPEWIQPWLRPAGSLGTLSRWPTQDEAVRHSVLESEQYAKAIAAQIPKDVST